MGTLNVFNFISLNGFYKDLNDSMAWHSHNGEEEKEFSSKNAQREGMLLFGRKTYELMSSFWPTDAGQQTDKPIYK